MRRSGPVLALLGIVASVGVVTVERTRSELEAFEACEAAASGDVERGLAVSDDADVVAGCPPLAGLWIREHRANGRDAEAAALARRAARANPDDFALFVLELETRAALEDEAALLRELSARVPEAGEAATRMRVALAQRHLQRGDPPAALAALGPELPRDASAARGLWFDTLGIAHAMNDDRAAAREAYVRWERAGGLPAEVRARHALALDVAGLAAGPGAIDALRGARRDAETAGDATLEETLAIRLIFHLVSAGRAREAIDVYDALHPRLALGELDRDELERARRGERLAQAPGDGRPGTLRFGLAADAAGGALLVTPDVGAAPDAAYERHTLAPRETLALARTPALAPQRWVLRADDGRVLASGAAYPIAGETVEVAIGAPAPSAPPPSPDLSRLPADGRRRVAFVLLDCADWRLARYLRARGDLPVLDALLRSGHRAVLDSDPPLTAAALEALVWPERRADVSLVGTFHRLGVELAGLESIGRNPFAWLSWVMPETRGLFEVIGTGGRRAANLLLAHGGVRAGRHGEVHGPHGATQRLALGATRRPLDAAERARFPGLVGLEEMDAHYVETIAAELDATERLLREREIDLVAVRVEPLDILTHAHFGDVVRAGRDDGRGLLYEVYRYVDARIGALHAALDADDVLIVASDHGIRTAMQHDRPALFVAAGAGIPHGRAPGMPSLRGVARVLAELLGVHTAWPDTGVAPWAGGLAGAPPAGS